MDDPPLSPPRFEVWRQDQQGEHELVQSYSTAVEAQNKLEELTEEPTEQTFFIKSIKRSSR